MRSATTARFFFLPSIILAIHNARPCGANSFFNMFLFPWSPLPLETSNAPLKTTSLQLSRIAFTPLTDSFSVSNHPSKRMSVGRRRALVYFSFPHHPQTNTKHKKKKSCKFLIKKIKQKIFFARRGKVFFFLILCCHFFFLFSLLSLSNTHTQFSQPVVILFNQFIGIQTKKENFHRHTFLSCVVEVKEKNCETNKLNFC